VALIPHFGVNGAAAAMLVGAILAFALGAERLHRRGYVMTGSSILLVGYAVAALMIAPYLTQNNALDSIPIKIVACLLLIGGLWLFLTPEEKASVRHFGRQPAAPVG
jgi:threonine/homoserine efflux transporter RhtA